MPREPYFGDTGDEVQKRFEQLMVLVGGKADHTRDRRVYAVEVDGVTLAERQMELVRAGSNFYTKEYLEAFAVARMLVDLGIDAGAEVFRRNPPMPDTEVRWPDKKRFVEVRLVGDQHIISMPRYAEAINSRLLELRGADPTFDNLFGGWTVFVRVGYMLEDERESVNDVVVELERLMRDVAGEQNCKPVQDPSRYPILTKYRAVVNSSPANFETVTMIQAGEPSWGAPPVLDLIKEAIREKQQKHYDEACRPMQLLLSIADERHVPSLLRETLETGLAGVPIFPFEMVVIIHGGMRPFVIGA